MVRPCCFGFNPQTAVNNAFQVPSGKILPGPGKALLEFDHFVALLHKHNVDVIVVRTRPNPIPRIPSFPTTGYHSIRENGHSVSYVRPQSEART